LAFNLDPLFNPSQLSVLSCSETNSNPTNVPPGAICTTYQGSFPATQNSYILQGAGNGTGFDFDYANAGSGTAAKRFNGDELVTLIIQGPAGLNAQSFAFLNTPSGQGSEYIGYGGTKVNGIPGGLSGAIGTNGNGTTSVPGPLPVLGAAAAFGYSRKLRLRIQSSRQHATIS
jgi:hypothetical protein